MAIGTMKAVWTVCGLLAIGACTVVLGARPVSAQVTLTKVIASGDPAPGGGTCSNVSGVTIGPSGHLGIISIVANGGTRRSLMGGLPNQVTLIARATDPAPGTPAGVTFSDLTSIKADVAGRFLFTGILTGTGVTTLNDDGVWLSDAGVVTLIAREGDQAPGLPAGTLLTNIGPLALASGRVAFASNLTGGGTTSASDRAIWRFSDGALSLVARKGLPSVVAGTTWQSLSDPRINASGQLAFAAKITPGTSTDDSIICMGLPGSLSLVAREGASAPGTGTGVVFVNDFFANISFNDAGEVAFAARVTGTGVTIDNARGLWRRTGAVTSLIARQGQGAASFTAPQPSFIDFAFVGLGGSGMLTWGSGISGTGVTTFDDFVAFRRVNSQLQTVIRESQAAAGEAAGVTYSGFGTAIYSAPATINATGAMLLRAPVNGPGITSSTPSSLTGLDPTGGPGGGPALVRIVRAGDPAPIGSAVVPQVSTIDTAETGGTQEGGARALSDTGVVAMRIGLTNGGSGAFIANFIGVTSTGACCTGATCSLVPSVSCSGLNTRFVGAGTACNATGNAVTPCCLADFNASGDVSIQDLFDFLAAWFALTPAADINRAGGTTVQDLFDFLTAWFAGC